MKEIDKWLDNEYGCSYTRLEELHDFVVEQDLKHREEADKEIQKLNNIIQKAIKKLENEIKYLEHLDKIGAMYSTEQNRFNNSLLQELKGSNLAIPPEVIGTNGVDGGLFDYGDR